MSDLAIGIDIGGTKVAGGVLDEQGAIVARARRDTPHRSKRPQVVEDTIVDVVHELMTLQPTVEAVGIGAAGAGSAAVDPEAQPASSSTAAAAAMAG